MESSDLCQACHGIFDWVSAHWNAHFLTNLTDPLIGPGWTPSNSSCSLCALFSYNMSRTLFRKLCDRQDETCVYTIMEVSFPDRCVQLVAAQADKHDVLGSPRLLHREVYFRVEFDKAASGATSRIPDSTWSLSTIRQIKSWLSTCVETHAGCKHSEEERHLPLRLLDVNPEGNGAPCSPASEEDLVNLSIESMPAVRVCLASELPVTTEYLTLSHRWDPRPSIMLSDNTLATFSTAIPPELLNDPKSKTFKDAICATRCLGFRYLWIDSICINQDDEGELAREIASMHQIYATGTINLSATGADEAADGLFFPRTSSNQPCRKGSAGSCRQAGSTSLVACLPFGWIDMVSYATINTRGWVFQERMLSQRVLHFARPETYWECFSAQKPEGCIRDDLYRFPHRDMAGNKTELSLSNKRLDFQGKTTAGLWNHFTTSYSEICLTKQTDRLLALSGLSRHFGVLTGRQDDDYCAGLWYPDLPTCLLWEARYDRMPTRTPEDTYVAPSWSWASTGGLVTGGFPYMSDEGELVVDDMSISITNENDDRFGRVISGSLFIRGSLCQVSWRRETRTLECLLGKKSAKMPCKPHWDSPCFAAKRDTTSEVQRPSIPEVWVMLPGNSRLYISGDALYLLPVEDWGDKIRGLILHPALQQGQYVRVGLVEANEAEDDSDDDSEDWPENEEEKLSDDTNDGEVEPREERSSDHPGSDTDEDVSRIPFGFRFFRDVLFNAQNLGSVDVSGITGGGKRRIEIL